jgi:MYXO-CTERM domain-containing protein
MRALLPLALALALPLATPALAGPRVEGTAIRIHYGDQGVWNDRSVNAGFQSFHGDRWVDWSYPGAPFATWRMAWNDGGSSPEEWFGNSNTQAMNAEILSFEDLSTSTHRVARYTFKTGFVGMRRTEAWRADGSALLMHVFVDNTDTRTLTDLRYLFAIDPDPDYGTTANTTNDVVATAFEDAPDAAVATGPTSGNTIVFAACDPSNAEVGFFGGWTAPGQADVRLDDPNGTDGDLAIGVRARAAEPIPPGGSTVLALLVAVGDTAEEALANLEDARELCSTCDVDGDGWLNATCGGEDCDDTDPAVFPGAPDALYDGIDGDCDGESDYDQDGDGFDAADQVRPDGTSGTDCDDTDPAINTAAQEIWYDGIDQDCDGESDYDQDGDGFDSAGHGGDDCNDSDASVNPSATDAEGDGVDSDCDGNDAPRADTAEPVGGGCGCATGPTGAGWLALALAATIARRRRR